MAIHQCRSGPAHSKRWKWPFANRNRRAGVHRPANGGALWPRRSLLHGGAVSSRCGADAGISTSVHTSRGVYRAGIADANKSSTGSSGKPFADLTPDKQDEFLGQMEKGKISFEKIPAASFFAQLLENTREGISGRPDVRRKPRHGCVEMDRICGARADFTDWIN